MAEEVAAGLPTATVVASEDEALALRLQEALNSAVFRVYVNDDPLGVELCAAAKNVIALAAGGIDGLGLGDNAKAALISRGLAEMARLGEEAGADPDTFSGLAGMGDLIVTCWHDGRNRRAGELIARGRTADEAAAEIGQVVEGLTTAPVLRDLSHRLGVELPLTEAVCRVLDGVPVDELSRARCGASRRRNKAARAGRLRRRQQLEVRSPRWPAAFASRSSPRSSPCSWPAAAAATASARAPASTARALSADAIAYVSLDTDLESGQWDALRDHLDSFPEGDRLVDRLLSSLAEGDVSWDRDVEPALGPEVAVVALPGQAGDSPSPVILTQSDDPAKLDALFARSDQTTERREIDGWQAVCRGHRPTWTHTRPHSTRARSRTTTPSARPRPTSRTRR